MNTLRKVELTALVSHIMRFSTSGIPIYNPEVVDTVGREITIRRTQDTVKRHAFHAKVIEEVKAVKWLPMNKTYCN